MEAVLVLAAFYRAIATDPRISPAHISLYMALFQRWRTNDFKNPVCFTSREIMPMAKIGSRATYHKCLQDLVECGYIRYSPSFNPLLKSLAFLDDT